MLLTPSETKSIAAHNSLHNMTEFYGQVIQEMTSNLNAARETIQLLQSEDEKKNVKIKSLEDALAASLTGTLEVEKVETSHK